jgi:prepilin-type N-terminal cleavage/methylation domain-containing protein
MQDGTYQVMQVQKRSAFTLTELLVVISIIGVITSSLAFVVAGAQERARQLRTRSQLQRIEAILQREILELLEARIPVRTPPIGDFPGGLGPHQRVAEGSLSRNQRFWTEARRVDLMYRFPYRRELVQDFAPRTVSRPVIGQPDDPLFRGFPSVYYQRVNQPPSYQRFHSIPNDLRAIRDIARAGMDFPIPNAKTDSAELLYAILKRIWVDGEPALSLLRESEIGDTDRDGVKEIIDVWGNPIYFRLEILIPVTAPSGEGLFAMPLDEYSAWMTRFTWNSQVFEPISVAPEVFSPERVRVRVFSSGIESNFDPDASFPIFVETM